MKVVKIDHSGTAEFHAAHFIRRRPCPGVVPWPDYEKMFCTRFRRSVRQMIAIKCECPELVAVVLARNRQNR